MAKKASKAESSPIVRGSQVYLVLHEVGELNEKGKRVFSIGYGGKRLADKKYPLSSLVIPIAAELTRMIRYPDGKSLREDLAMLKEYVNGLGDSKRPAKKTAKPEEPTHVD